MTYGLLLAQNITLLEAHAFLIEGAAGGAFSYFGADFQLFKLPGMAK